MRIEERVEIEAPRQKVWELVSDPSLYPRFMSNIRQMEPRGQAPSAIKTASTGEDEREDEDARA
ncbi:MAG: SRPBCC family protein, partial [Thermoleophilaceae bacterium]